MELINNKQSFLYNKVQDKTIQETIIKKEVINYVIVNVSLRDMK